MIRGAATPAFHWHAHARLHDAAGAETPRAASYASRLSDRPAAAALAAALAGNGAPFRIGDPDAPAPGRGFETLTSGSTGSPKRIARSFASWTASFAVNARLFGTGPDAVVAILGRLAQSLSLYGATEALHLGATLHLLDGLAPRSAARALADRAVTQLWATPTQAQLLVDTGVSLPALRHLLIGGAKLHAPLRTALSTLCPNVKIHEFYGAAEASFITLSGPTTPDTSVGTPYPGVQIEARDPQGRVADEGQLWVQSPYLADVPLTNGWLPLGEVGRIENHHLYLLGRIDRMVTIAGQNVFPEAIEAFLLTLPGITQAAVLPRPDPLRGTVLEAVATGDPSLADAILTATRARFGLLASPRKLCFRADWPLLPSGKTDLVALAK